MHRFALPLTTGVMVIAALVLLVTCTNLANLLLARGAARRNELAVRFAVGGSRWRIVREQLAESALVAGAGGLLALGFARWVVVELSSTSMRIGPGVNWQLTPTLSSSVSLAAAGATLAAYLVFGLVPALYLTRSDLRQLLASDDAGSAPRVAGRPQRCAETVVKLPTPKRPTAAPRG